ncbi:Kinesin motor family protein [Forsythia ovata]|uniref:Kinesin motor family protein n=1 Tax=Forsythia ovata TaxID=205694 RepID=A0ABD1QM81_9LAMI
MLTTRMQSLKMHKLKIARTPASDISKEEPLVVRLKARMQEMKEKELMHNGNVDANSHVCKVCFESATAAMLLPCRHFCLCKSCSLACSECPICRTNIADRIFAFT